MSATCVTSLRCEYLVDPLGLDECRPRLSWLLATDRRGARQVAYRVRVASTQVKLAAGVADRWDSGRVESAQTAHVAYAGEPLRSRDACHWQVEIWDETGASVRSAPALWTMGLLEHADWSARWIAADPEIIRRDPAAVAPTLTEPGTPAVFRRAFSVPADLVRATLYASARGLFELRANGRRIGEDLFAPEWTDYDKRIHYRSYDVTALLSPGANELAATLGDGWWSGFVGWQETKGRYGSLENSLLLQLELELADGTRRTVGTDGAWQCATGPILSSDLQMGEVYDARREPRDWRPAREVAAPAAPLVAQRSEPVRITETRAPVSRTEIRPGVHLYDLGQNLTGWIRLRVEAPAGTRIQLRHGERLNPDGTLYTANLRRAKATDVYICRGGGIEVFEPHFTFHGFQYVELSGLPGVPRADAVTGCVIHSATPPAGHFECSHAGVNRLWLNGVWSQRDNFLSVPTDCPQRDERLGWMGDAQVFFRTATCNMDVAAFFTKWMIDVEDAQTPDGVFPDIAPRLREDINWVGLGNLGGAAGWADAGIIIPYTFWRVYGDLRLVERHWGAMVRWLDWIERHNPNGLRVNQLANNYGDWLCIPSDTSFGTHSPMKNLLATAYWADDAAKMARLARALGRAAEAARFQAMFEKVRAAFQSEWVRPDGRISVETQTAYLLGLAFDLLPSHLRAAATEHLVANIRNLDWHLSTGFVGIGHLNPQLTLAGRADVAYRLLLQESYPSWLFPVLQGATTIWERWDSWTIAGGFHKDGMNSFNHYSLGSVGEWLFRHVLGIELDPETPAYQRFVLQPFIGAGLDHARGHYRSIHGEIRSAWQRRGAGFEWQVTIPANTTARVHIPAAPGATVGTDGLTVVERTDAFAICEAPAGSYTFTSTLAPA
ncbi:family 78 glycoside hydrolase catalytic domain [Oleiharenicola sp. Vm1]|uniref:family 78 glycoside hydrolase catalytic domain n=1 Tax=Oleiharenicola sp. Vm1 TaxID=3398393 RepID=UPI0039F50EE5